MFFLVIQAQVFETLFSSFKTSRYEPTHKAVMPFVEAYIALHSSFLTGLRN